MKPAGLVATTFLLPRSASLAAGERAWALWVKSRVLFAGENGTPKTTSDLGRTFANQPECDRGDG